MSALKVASRAKTEPSRERLDVLVRLLLMAAPLAAGAGGLLPVAGPFFAFRMLVLALIALVLLPGTAQIDSSRGVAIFVTLGFVWISVGLASTFFVRDFDAAARELLALLLGLAFALTLICLPHKQDAVRALEAGWIIALLVTSAVGVRELLTGQHLPNYLLRLDPLVVKQSHLVASLFGNPNAFAAFLVSIYPFLARRLVLAQGKRRFWVVGAMLLDVAMILPTGSRICVVAVVILTVISIALGGRRFRRSVLSVVIAAAAALVIVGIGAVQTLLLRLIDRPSYSGGLIGMIASASDQSSSSGIRLNLIKDGFWMLQDTYGLGVGAGNFEPTMASGTVPYPTSGTIDPHNAWMEVLAQYGIVVALILAIWLVWCFRVGVLALRPVSVVPNDGLMRSFGMFLIMSVVGLALSGTANSSFLDAAPNWVLLGSMALILDMVERTNTMTTEPKQDKLAAASEAVLSRRK